MNHFTSMLTENSQLGESVKRDIDSGLKRINELPREKQGKEINALVTKLSTAISKSYQEAVTRLTKNFTDEMLDFINKGGYLPNDLSRSIRKIEDQFTEATSTLSAINNHVKSDDIEDAIQRLEYAYDNGIAGFEYEVKKIR